MDELDDLSLTSSSSVRIDVTGMVQEWISKAEYVNRGLLVVYEGFPDNSGGSVQIDAVPTLEVKYRQSTPTCEEIAKAGFGLKTDFDNDCKVGLSDFVKLAVRWLDCNEPTDTNCF